MTDTKRTTVYLDRETADYIKWKTRGAGYEEGNTMKRIIDTGIRILMGEDVGYQNYLEL